MEYVTAKQFTDFSQKLDEKFDLVFKRFDQHDLLFAEIFKRFDHVDERFRRIDERFVKLETKLDDHISETRIMNEKMDARVVKLENLATSQ